MNQTVPEARGMSLRRSVAFYTQQLGFQLDLEQLPAFAQVSIGNLKAVGAGRKILSDLLI